MLPSKLRQIKNELSSQIHRDQDDEKTLRVLNLLDSDPDFQRLIQQNDFMTKSYTVAAEYCPVCGKRK
jgi:hypothetical protein